MFSGWGILREAKKMLHKLSLYASPKSPPPSPIVYPKNEVLSPYASPIGERGPQKI
jgi:hypothetical protein